MEIKPYKRAKVLIYPKFQIKFISFSLVAVILGLFIFYLAQLYFIKDMYLEGMALKLPNTHIYFKMVAHQESNMKMIFLFASGVVFLFLLVFGLLLSHRIAGPLVKLNNYLEKLSENKDPGELVFRKKDFFHEIPKTLNKYLHQKRQKGHFEFVEKDD